MAEQLFVLAADIIKFSFQNVDFLQNTNRFVFYSFELGLGPLMFLGQRCQLELDLLQPTRKLIRKAVLLALQRLMNLK